MSLGRPSLYSAELAHLICERLATGQSLAEICRDDAMPHRATVTRWLKEHELFSAAYALAREAQADHFADEILEIAEDGSNDWMDRKNGDGSTTRVIDHEHVQRSKLRIDSRKWLMMKFAPKKYGDKVAVGGDDDAPPIRLEHDTDLARRLAFILTKGAQGAKESGA